MNDWYENYLKSPHWLALKERKLEEQQRLCERCGEGAKRRGEIWVGLQVHHRTYERVGREELSDLEVLCVHCHQVEHGLAEDTEWNRIKIRRRLAAKVVEDWEWAYSEHAWELCL